MSFLHQLQASIDVILSPLFMNGSAGPRPLNTPADIKLSQSQSTQVEKNPRLLKTNINDEIRPISHQYADTSALVRHYPVVGGVFGLEEARHLSAHDRQPIHHKKIATLESYHHAIRHIDQRIGMLDHLKLQINQAKAQSNFQTEPSGPLFWYTCPFCGFQLQTPGGLVRCPRCGR